MTLPGSPPASDTEPPAQHRPRPPGRWHRLYALAVVLVMTSALVYQLWRDPGSGSEPQHVGSSPARGAEVGTTPVHQRTVTSILGPDRIRVVEHLTYTAPVDVVTLVSPARSDPVGEFAPTVTELWLDSGTGPQEAAAPAPGDAIRVQLPEPVSEVTVGYLATGVVVRTPGSATGRALALVTPLRADGPSGLRAVEVRGVWVDNLGCLDADGGASACGHATSLGWATSASDAGLTDVVAQLTLPSG